MAKTATKEQLNIITTTEGRQRCSAVPGSGKTYVLVERIAYLITQLYIDPSSITALTFTNKAATEMKRRLKNLIGDETECFAGTFHGLGNKILKEECYKLNWPKTFVILDKKDQINLIREIAEELNLSMTDMEAKAYLDSITEIKQGAGYVNYVIGPDKMVLLQQIQSASSSFDKVLFKYLLKQRDNFMVDYTDMIQFPLYILNTYSDIKDKWQDRCQYVLCDEFQDVNQPQLNLLRILSGKYQNLFIVGDDDQAIYGWRNAKVEYMIDFVKNYQNVNDFYLSENFRSTPEIVDVANSLIGNNQNRIPKVMFTNNPHGNKPAYNNAKTEKAEAMWIADTIVSNVAKGRKYSDHAILIRASSQSRALEEAFVTKKIPYKIYSGAKFYATEEIKTTISYLRMIYALSDLDFEQTINRPRRKFGKKSLAGLKEYAKQNGLTLFNALGEQIQLGLMKKPLLVDYYNQVNNLHNIYQNFTSKDLVNMVLDIGYRKELQQDVDQTKLDNVTELIATITNLEAENDEPIPLEDLLTHFALFTNQDEDDDEKNVVKIMTVHTAKGLEFETVFVNGLVEGLFPSGKLKNEDEMEEERRLFYVAVTRAKKELYLSSYSAKSESFVSYPSRFLSNIDRNLLHFVNNSSLDGAYYTKQMRPKAEFNIGDKVSHPAFGQGNIVGVDERGLTYDIKFDIFSEPRRIQFRANLIKL